MDINDATRIYNLLIDGQFIRVTVKSGRQVDGIYNGEDSSPEDGLFFETTEGNPVYAEWSDIQEVGFRTARQVTADNFMLPPEHPYSQQKRKGAYTARNR